MNIQRTNFDNLKEFHDWKLEEEQKCKSFYVQHSSSQTYGTNKHWYLHCNRSGIAKTMDERERQVKSHGSCKTGTFCVAHMKVIQDIIIGKVQVQCCSTHNSHAIEIAHLPDSTNVKAKIDTKLHEGVAIERRCERYFIFWNWT